MGVVAGEQSGLAFSVYNRNPELSLTLTLTLRTLTLFDCLAENFHCILSVVGRL